MPELESAHAEVGRRFREVLVARDWPGLADLLAEDVIWEFPGDAVISGTVRGRDSVIERYRSIVSREIDAELLQVMSGRNGVALSFHNTAQDESGRSLDQYMVNALFVSDGRIERMETFLSNPDGVADYFGAAA
ncbi:MAG: nuclear transport factor 2 family protein [Actinobacteria bacterium]|nr:nuclear transport factor 2 family protein [Actinomycetota bacterium]